MRVVVDTNVFVSAILSPLGPPAQILNLILSREITLIISPLILEEYEEVLNRNELALDEKAVAALLRVIHKHAENVFAPPQSDSLPDPNDQAFLDCAIAGNADYLVTGNRKHFPPHLCHPIQSVSPAEFLMQKKGSSLET